MNHRFGDSLRHLDDAGVIALLPAFLEACPQASVRTTFSLPLISKYSGTPSKGSIANLLKICFFLKDGHPPCPISILYEVLLLDLAAVQSAARASANQLGFLHVDGLQILIVHRCWRKLSAHPLDSRLFVADKHLYCSTSFAIDPTLRSYSDLVG